MWSLSKTHRKLPQKTLSDMLKISHAIFKEKAFITSPRPFVFNIIQTQFQVLITLLHNSKKTDYLLYSKNAFLKLLSFLDDV